MSVGFRVQCDGRDGTCDSSEVVARAQTPEQAIARVRDWGWAHVDGDDLCRRCQVDPRGVATAAGVQGAGHWSDR